MTDAVPAPIRDLATLFADALGGVKFPDVDATALGAAVARVDELAANVARLEDELAQARAALDTGSGDLARLATRAHAYARVFADDNDDLRARVDAIALPRPRALRSASAPSPASTPSAAASPSATPASPSPASDDPTATASPGRRRRKTGTDDAAQLFGGGASASAES